MIIAVIHTDFYKWLKISEKKLIRNVTYCIYPNQTVQNVASDQGSPSLPQIQQFLDISTGSKMY